jgi:hypothetical protein
MTPPTNEFYYHLTQIEWGRSPQFAIKEPSIGNAPAMITVAPISVSIYKFPVAQQSNFARGSLHVFLHHIKLASKTVGQLSNHPPFACQHQDHHGAQE